MRERILAEYEAISRMDWPAVLRDAHEDFEFTPPERGLANEVRGREKAREAIESFFSPYEEVTIEPLEFHERGDRIAVYFLLSTRPHGSSKMVEVRAGHVWTVRDDRLARLQIFPEREEALAAAESTEAEVSAEDEVSSERFPSSR